MQKGPSFDIRTILQIAQRRKWFLIVPIVLAVIACVAIIQLTIPMYLSKTTIQLGPFTTLTGRMSQMLPGVTAENRVRMRDNKEAIFKQLSNKITLGKVIDRVGMKPKEAQVKLADEAVRKNPSLVHEEALRTIMIEQMLAKMTLDFAQRSEYFELGTKSTNPQNAYLITKTLAELFIEENLMEGLNTLKGTAEFASTQMEKYRIQLQDAEDALRAYRRSMAQTSNQNLTVNSANLPQVNSLIQSYEAAKLKYVDELNTVESRLGDLNSEIRMFQSDEATQIKAQLIEKISKQAELLISFPWNNGDVLRIGTEISKLKDRLRAEIRRTGPRDLQGTYGHSVISLAIRREVIETEISLLNKQINTLNRLIDLFNSARSTIPVQELTLNNLQAKVEMSRQLYQTFVDQANSARIREAMQSTEIKARYRIIDPAQIPVTPINTDFMQVILIASIAGLGLGVGMVYLLEMLDNSYKGIEEIETALGVSVLGIVPKMNLGTSEPKKKALPF
ncbi:MAG: hypothetical protein H6696_07620 [Deferribacteres bacterium]|nr:hypothetical protein [candidate division KSB1 bacterium]MCB9501793.1 hypothetical protein [Deferribacteres bacterium]